MIQSFAKSMLLPTVILMDVLGGAEMDLFVPSFPELQARFDLSPFLLEALLSVNFIGFFLSLLFIGGLADRYGRKPIILTGLLIFSIGSLLCVWAPSYPFLLAGRFLQGMGVAAPATLYFLIIADAYPLQQQLYLMAMLNGIINASIGAAPVVGSYITLYFHWRGNFIALLLLGLATLVMTVFFIPSHTLLSQNKTKAQGSQTSLLRSKPLWMMIIFSLCLNVPYWIFVGMSPILYMQDLGVSLSQFGFYQGALASIYAVGSIFAGLMVSRYNQKKMLGVSNLICMAGAVMIALAAFINSADPLLITLTLLFYTVGAIMPNTILYPLCINYLPQAKGRVAAIIQGGRLILTALSLEVAGYFYQGSFQQIGVLLIGFIMVAVITLFAMTRNDELMHSLR
jgi:DHA1 family bicyclomycin/chloramphenicol resistance-like MFS transporter